MIKKNLITVEDLTRVIRLSRITIYRATYSGRLKALKIVGGRLWTNRRAKFTHLIWKSEGEKKHKNQKGGGHYDREEMEKTQNACYLSSS